MGADRLLDKHRGEVAEQHRRRTHRHLAERGDRKLQRIAAGSEHALADVLGDDAEMRVAGRQLGPGVADADDGPSLETVLRRAAVLQERSIVEAHLVLTAEPRLAAQLFFGVAAHCRFVSCRSARATACAWRLRPLCMTSSIAKEAASGSPAVFASTKHKKHNNTFSRSAASTGALSWNEAR